MPMKLRFTLLLILLCTGTLFAQSLIPNPFAYTSCISFASPTGWANCTGSPDCAASRCTVPGGCSGQAVMCFGESFYYTLPSPLTIGQNYTVAMNVSTGQLGASTIIGGNHTFNVIGLTSAPTNCMAANYGSVCSTPGSTLLLSGTVNTIGWVSFTNTFTAASAIRYIVIGNCDGTGNGGNLFCNFTLSPSVVFPIELADFSVTPSGCEVDAQWAVHDPTNAVSHFELLKYVEGEPSQVVAEVPAQPGQQDYRLTDAIPAPWMDYQLQAYYRDGAISQSAVEHVQTTCPVIPNAIEGNPVRGNEATLRYRATGLPMRIQISNTEGRIVRQLELPAADEGWQRQTLDVSGLQSGIYFVNTGNGQIVKLQLLR